MDITGSWSGFRWWYPGVWLEDTWVEFDVCCFYDRELPFKVIVFHLCMFDSIFFSGIYLIAVPALEFGSPLLVKCFHMSFQSCACCKGLLANVALKNYIYWMRLRPAGCLELKMLIYTSFVRRRMLMLLDVWVTMVAIMSSEEWLYDVKWRETGLNAFPCLMSVK